MKARVRIAGKATTLDHAALMAARERAEQERARTPYPTFCRHVHLCVGKSHCPRDPNCAD